MMKKMAVAALLAAWSLAWADYTLVFEMKDSEKPENTMLNTFLYKDAEHRRIDMTIKGDMRSSLLVSGNKAYIIAYDDQGVPSVIDADTMMQMARTFGGGAEDTEHVQPAAVAQKSEKVRWRKTGKHRKIAGIDGEVWQIEYDAGGKPETATVVLSKDPEYIEAMNAYIATMKRMMSGGSEDAVASYMLGTKPGYAPLAIEGVYTLEKMDNHRIDQKRFELPKEASVQQNPFGTLFGTGGDKKHEGKTAALEDACYTQVCCGQTQGDAKVLPKMTAKSAMGYRLESIAKCEMLGLGALFGIDSVEGALYKKGADTVTVTLDMDVKDEGTVRKANNDGTAHGYRSGKIDGATYYYAVLKPMDVQMLDIVIEEGVIVSLSHRMSKGTVDLVGFAKHALDLDAYRLARKAAPATEASRPKADTADDEDPMTTENINKNVDKAVDFIKSIF